MPVRRNDVTLTGVLLASFAALAAMVTPHFFAQAADAPIEELTSLAGTDRRDTRGLARSGDPRLAALISVVTLQDMIRTSIFACAVLLGATCGDASQRPLPDPLRTSTLLNMDYRLPEMAGSSEGRTVKVRGGAWAQTSADGPQHMTIVDTTARGDFNGDGTIDAVVVMAFSGGGSGIFYSLATVLNDHGRARHVASISVSDRIHVKSVEIRGGRITAHLIVQGDDDALCCPTLAVTRVFRLRDATLVEEESRP